MRLAAALVAALVFLGACTGDDQVPLPPGSTNGTSLSWRAIAHAPTERQEVAAAELDGKIYVLGGLLADGTATDAVEIYDPAADRWTAGPDLPVAVHHGMATVRRGMLVAIGGFRETLGGRAISDVYILEGNRWRRGPSMRRPRAAGAAVTVDDEVIVVGGISAGAHVGPVEIFDGTSWRDGASIESVRDHIGAATDGKLVYVAGGRRAGGHFATFEAYDPDADRWSKLTDMPTARSGIGAAFVGGKIVTVGGEGPRIFPEVEAFDTSTRRWTRLPDLTVPVHGVGAVAVDENLYALVGGSRVGLAPTSVCQVLAIA